MKKTLMMLLIATMGMFTTTSNAQSLPFLETYVDGDGEVLESGQVVSPSSDPIIIPIPSEGRINLEDDSFFSIPGMPSSKTYTIIPAKPKGSRIKEDGTWVEIKEDGTWAEPKGMGIEEKEPEYGGGGKSKTITPLDFIQDGDRVKGVLDGRDSGKASEMPQVIDSKTVKNFISFSDNLLKCSTGNIGPECMDAIAKYKQFQSELFNKCGTSNLGQCMNAIANSEQHQREQPQHLGSSSDTCRYGSICGTQ